MNFSSSSRLAAVLTTLVVLAGCGAQSGAEPAAASARVGAAGGSLTAGGTTLAIPASALKGEVEVHLREVEPGNGRAVRVEIEPRGLSLDLPALLSVKVDDSNGRVKMIGFDDSGAEHLVQVEVEDRARHSWKTVVSRLGHVEVEVEHARSCSVACGANEECDDGVCKPHAEHAPGAACSTVCASGLECEHGACAPHGGNHTPAPGTSPAPAPAACDPGCAAGLECDDGICKPHGGGGNRG
jgi:hypothetical protein